MPLPPSGDSGAGHGDDEFDDPFGDAVEFRPPLPPEDRIWRHPSEVAGTGARATSPAPVANRGRSGLAIAIVSGLIGATLTVGVIAAFGGFESRTRVVERQVAVQPVTSAVDDDSVAAITTRTAPSVAGVYVTRDDERTDGSAVVVRSDGHLLTNADLVADADRIEVRVNGQPVRRAEIVGSDETTGLAVLHVDVEGLEPAPMGSAEHLRPGDAVVAIGHAHGTQAGASVEQSVVSERDRRLRTPAGTVLYGMIVLDTPLPDGAAGGPLLDGAGAVVGVTNAVPSADDERTHGVATPADVAVHAAEQLMVHGQVRHVWLGIEGIDLQPADAAELGLPGGAAIKHVVADSPAAEAGLQPGDVVVGVGDHRVSSMSEVIASLRAHEPGDSVDVTVRRGDDEVRTEAVLDEKAP